MVRPCGSVIRVIGGAYLQTKSEPPPPSVTEEAVQRGMKGAEVRQAGGLRGPLLDCFHYVLGTLLCAEKHMFFSDFGLSQ